MSDTDWIVGGCNCKKIKVTIRRPVAGEMKLCHCIDCRKFTGAIAAYLLTMHTSDVRVEGQYKTWSSVGDTGLSVCRYFCDECGSSLYDTGDCNPDYLCLHSGIFPPGTIPAPDLEIYWCNAEKWETLHPECEVMDRQ